MLAVLSHVARRDHESLLAWPPSSIILSRFMHSCTSEAFKVVPWRLISPLPLPWARRRASWKSSALNVWCANYFCTSLP
eukprot:11183280-Prorocentrum_lima.AAC.1